LNAAIKSVGSPSAARIYNAIGVAKTGAELDDLIKLVWRDNLAGAIDDADAMHLVQYAEQRRPRSAMPLSAVVAEMPAKARIPIAEPNLRPIGSRSYRSRFSSRREQCSPDKQRSYERRHRLAFSGVMPRFLAPNLTIGDMAVMRVVCDEYVRAGGCELSLAELAARSGVCRKSAKRAMQIARDERLISIEERPVRGQRHKPNFIRIISFEWLKWLRRGRDDEGDVRRDAVANAVADCDNDIAVPRGHTRQGLAENVGFRGPRMPGGGGHFGPPTETTLTDDGDSVVEFGKTDTPPKTAPPQDGWATKEAIAFAEELAGIAGYQLGTTADPWRNANPPQVVQIWLNELDKLGKPNLHPFRTPVELLRYLAQHVMERKRASDSSPPYSPRYFGAEIYRFVERTERAKSHSQHGRGRKHATRDPTRRMA
jgi:hypothetical protein